MSTLELVLIFIIITFLLGVWLYAILKLMSMDLRNQDQLDFKRRMYEKRLDIEKRRQSLINKG